MGKTRVQEAKPEEVMEQAEKLEEAVTKGVKVKKKKKLPEAKLYMWCTFNNTICTLTDLEGNVYAWSSAGAIGFKGTRKKTPYAASKVAEVISQKAQKLGVEKWHIIVKGIGPGRDSALKTLANQGIAILSITDATPIPHNGCRPPKPRRV